MGGNHGGLKMNGSRRRCRACLCASRAACGSALHTQAHTHIHTHTLHTQVFPGIASDGKLFAFTLPGYWMDVGQPKDYLLGACVCACAWCVVCVCVCEGGMWAQCGCSRGFWAAVHPALQNGACTPLPPPQA